MDINQQGGEWLRLKQENNAVELEIASILASLRRFGLSLAGNAKIIRDDAARWNVDTNSFYADLLESAANAERYRELQGEQADIHAALSRFENSLVRV